MAVVTIKTDSWDFSADAIVALQADLWDFVLTPSPGVTLKTDKWSILFSGALPAFAPSIISAVARVQQGLAFPKFIFGGLGGQAADEYSLFKKSNDYTFAVWRSQVFRIGEPFMVKKIRLPLSGPIGSGQEIIPILRFDGNSDSSVGTIINSAQYTDSEQIITLFPDNFNDQVVGINDFFLELQFTGSERIGVTFPIFIEVEKIESET